VIDFSAPTQDQQDALKSHKELILKGLSSLIHSQLPEEIKPLRAQTKYEEEALREEEKQFWRDQAEAEEKERQLKLQQEEQANAAPKAASTINAPIQVDEDANQPPTAPAPTTNKQAPKTKTKRINGGSQYPHGDGG
jgi:hypothetical protein